LARARDQCRDLGPAIRFERRRIPQAWPPGRFDLILLSEVLYYLDADTIRAAADRATRALQPGGCILMVHYLGGTDYPTTGDDAASLFMAAAADLSVGFATRTDGYRIDRLDRVPPG
jgi:hypothetical protein